MSRDHGGRMNLRLSNGILMTIRATVNIVSTRITVTAIANADGSVDRSAENKPGTAEVTIADRGIDYHALMNGERFNATLIEDFSNVTHYFNNAFFSGDPSVNRITGEVTGLILNYEGYERTEG